MKLPNVGELKPYPEMKDSGVEWLGEVPKHWEVRRLKQICRLAYGNTLTTEMRQDGTVPVFGSNGCVGFHSSANTKAPCIVVGRKGSFGKVNYSRDSVYAIDTTFFIDSRFSGAHIRWLFFLLRWLRLDEVTKDSAVPGLDREDAYQRLAPVPPLPEQTAIVRFLDHADRRIRRYIRAKQKLIALLEEQKQAIIHQAVTGQIDVRTGQPYPSYKDSGVEWLGDVPKHWEIWRLKTLCSMKSGEGITAESIEPMGEYPVYGGNGIRGYTSNYTHDGEFVLIGRQGALCGNIHVARGQFWASEHAVVAALNPGFVLEWFSAILGVMNLNQYSIAAAQPGLAVERVLNLWLPVPPPQEQAAIARYLDKTAAKIDAGVAPVRSEIDLIHEYRTRLIADVVTGKLDLREAAAELPEVDSIEAEDTLGDTFDTDTELDSAELDATLEEANA